MMKTMSSEDNPVCKTNNKNYQIILRICCIIWIIWSSSLRNDRTLPVRGEAFDKSILVDEVFSGIEGVDVLWNGRHSFVIVPVSALGVLGICSYSSNSDIIPKINA